MQLGRPILCVWRTIWLCQPPEKREEMSFGHLNKGRAGDWRPHVELAIHWTPTNIQWVLALVDTGAECTLLYGNPDEFLRPEASTDGYRAGGQCKGEGHVAFPGYWVIASAPMNILFMYPPFLSIYILDIDVLQG
ncbi:hypothetical protein HJG60_009893 [Phyllostomus discolor]|uniref:Uncharacterized protein n=1 Tax=Phyllostomus discolor TaxID=89673 RepID=A0A834ET64_9CHIR|nr:hypothetical protein HJG60_009893 [Phyllostomus discolor]